MDQKLKNEILASAKTNRVHKIPIVESPFEPEERNVIWLKDGVMYYFNNGEWESLYSTSGGDTPEPEPELDPKYVRTPIEFTEFELKEASMEGNPPLSAAISNMVSVQEEAIEYQEGTTITTKIPGYDDITSSDTPIYITAETTGSAAEFYAIVQMFLSGAYPNDTIEVVSVTYYQTENTALIIAKVNGENKTFAFVMAQSVPEGVTIIANSPAEPAVNETEFLRLFPREIYPITGFTPAVFNKWEEDGYTYAMVGYYSTSSVDYDYFKYFEGGGYQYIPAINGTGSGKLWGLRDVNDEKKLLYSYNHSNDTEDTINPIIPIGQQYLYYNANNGCVAITKDPNDLSKRMIFVELEQYQIEETGLSYDDILKAYFDVDNIADIPSISIDLYRYDPYH